MVRFRVASLALLLPAILLVFGGALGEVAVCIAEDCQIPHAAADQPEFCCEQDDLGPGSMDTPEHLGCRPSACRYVPVRADAAPAKAPGRKVVTRHPGELVGVVNPAYLPAVDLNRQPTPVLHQPGPQLRALKLTTVLLA